MKIKKVEDLRKCHWRKLTEQEWAQVPIHWQRCLLRKKFFVKKKDVKCFFKNYYKKTAREFGLSAKEKEVDKFLREENSAFHDKLSNSAKYSWFTEESRIFEEDFLQLKELLKMPVFISEEGKIENILEQVNQLSDEEKLIFAGEIWKNYLYPALRWQEREDMREFFK